MLHWFVRLTCLILLTTLATTAVPEAAHAEKNFKPTVRYSDALATKAYYADDLDWLWRLVTLEKIDGYYYVEIDERDGYMRVVVSWRWTTPPKYHRNAQPTKVIKRKVRKRQNR